MIDLLVYLFRYVQREKVKGTRSEVDPNTDVLRPEDVTEDMLKRLGRQIL